MSICDLAKRVGFLSHATSYFPIRRQFFDLPHVMMIPNPNGEPITLWLGNRFYADLPVEEYKTVVHVDCAVAGEWGDDFQMYAAYCRVRPHSDAPWEIIEMRRVE